MKKRYTKKRKWMNRLKRKLRKIFRKRLTASFTIEASVLVPMSLLLVAAVMVVLFFLHDRVLVSTVSTYEVMEHADRYKEEPGAVSEGISQMLEKRLIAAKGTDVTGEEIAGGFQVTAGAEVEIPLAVLKGMIGSESEEIHTVINVSNLNARETLVKYKTICDGLSYLGSGSEDE